MELTAASARAGSQLAPICLHCKALDAIWSKYIKQLFATKKAERGTLFYEPNKFSIC
jgi:hypothetical protein